MSKSSFTDANASSLALCLVKAIDENAAYLSEVDGAIGDGDHGINMKKGFDRFGTIAEEKNVKAASEGFMLLGSTLMTEIGGSMGPLYGTFFKSMGRAIRNKEIDAAQFLAMLEAGMKGVMDIGEARPGDKTMLDALDPAILSFKSAIEQGKSFVEALDAMAKAAQKGAAETVNMVARVGRASRLGERSRGVQDAGATSCAIILNQIVSTAKKLLNPE
jgi:dihydroxyacetone kinase-like protein